MSNTNLCGYGVSASETIERLLTKVWRGLRERGVDGIEGEGCGGDWGREVCRGLRERGPSDESLSDERQPRHD